MPDWTKSMEQTYEYYIVDPVTWKDERIIDTVISCSITRDKTSETLGSFSLEVGEELEECYVRVYLVTIQNGVRERFPLVTGLIQTPSRSFDGKSTIITYDGYTPLIELKEKNPPIGYCIPKEEPILYYAYNVCSENMRAPLNEPDDNEKLYSDYVSDPNETWLQFITELISMGKYHLELDGMGEVTMAPNQTSDSLAPVWTFTDDENSIFYPDVTISRDLYGIPNVVEVVYSKDNINLYSKVVNDDENNILSTKKRGREIVKRITSPSISGVPNQAQIDEYARAALEEASTLTATVSYKHGYCPVKLGDCVFLNYRAANIKNVKAVVQSQSIDCESGCSVTETATFTTTLWSST